MLTTLGPIPVRLIIKRTRKAIAARWINVRPPDVPAPQVTPNIVSYRRPLSPEWHTKGLCASLPVIESDVLFFGVEGRTAPAGLIAASNKACDLCLKCPWKARCLTEALEGDERYGVWGATSGRQREKMRARISEGVPIDSIVKQWLA